MEFGDLLRIYAGNRKPAQAQQMLELPGTTPKGAIPLRGIERLTVEETTEPLKAETFKRLLEMGESVPGVNEQAISADKLRDIVSMVKAQGVQTDLSPLAGFTKGILGRDIDYKAPEAAGDVFDRLGKLQASVGASEADRAASIISAMKMGMNQKKTTIGESLEQRQVATQSGSTPKLDLKGFGDRMAKDKVADAVKALADLKSAIPNVTDPNAKGPIKGFDQKLSKDNWFPDAWQPSWASSEEENANKQAVESVVAQLRNQMFGATLSAGEAESFAQQIGKAAGAGPSALRVAMKRLADTVQERLRNREVAQPAEANEWRKNYENTYKEPAPLSDHPVFGVESGTRSPNQPSPPQEPIDLPASWSDAKKKRYMELKGRKPQSEEGAVEMLPGDILQNGYRVEPSPGGFSRQEEGYITYPNGWRQEPQPEMFRPKRDSIDEFTIPPPEQSYDLGLDEAARGPSSYTREDLLKYIKDQEMQKRISPTPGTQRRVLKEINGEAGDFLQQEEEREWKDEERRGINRSPSGEVFTFPLELQSQFDLSSQAGISAYKNEAARIMLEKAQGVYDMSRPEIRQAVIEEIRAQLNKGVNGRLQGPGERRSQELQGTPYEALKPGLERLLGKS